MIDDTGAVHSPTHPLERLLLPLGGPAISDEGLGTGSEAKSAGIRSFAGTGPPEWLERGNWRLLARVADDDRVLRGEELDRFSTRAGRPLIVARDPASGNVTVPFSLADAYNSYVSEAWRHHARRRALSAGQLALFYRLKPLISRVGQLAARRILIRLQGAPEFPRWPLDRSVDSLLKFYARCLCVAAGGRELAFRWFWPQGYRSAVILTHDIESAAGLRSAIEVADLEEDRGLRSSFNVVADGYPIDHGILRELTRRGFEIGVHGIHHDRSMFASREGFEAQQPALRAAVERFGAAGFRSPATHRVYEWLAELPVDYDATMPHSDPYEPIPGGCCSLWPFFNGAVVELPYTMPQDHTLFTLLRHRTIDVWRRQLEAIHAAHGLTQCVSHPDPGYLGDADKRALYCELLDLIRETPGTWTPLPRDVARWWRERDRGDQSGNGGETLGRVRLGPGAEVRLEPATQPSTATGRSARAG
jgi:hypothetical protein